MFDLIVKVVEGDLDSYCQHQLDHQVLFFPGTADKTFTYWLAGSGLISEDVVKRWKDFTNVFHNGLGGKAI